MAMDIAQRIRQLKQIIQDLQIKPSDRSSVGELSDDYGLMKFDDDRVDETSRLSSYIRLALNTAPDQILELIEKGWKLSSPNLIISISGDEKPLDFSPKLKQIVQQGLIEAAITTNAWIITAGTNTGVGKEVGEAIENYRYRIDRQALDIPIIGISSWNSILGKEFLTNNIHPSPHSIEAIQMEVFDQYFVRSYVIDEKEEGLCHLESHHTHFLLFDDGLLDSNPSTVLPKRAALEKALKFSSKFNQTIPFTVILIEGGISSIETVCQALAEYTPVLIIKGSGGAADVLVRLYEYSIANSNADQLNALLRELADAYPWFDQTKENLWQILSERMELISIFDSTENQPFEDAILQSLFRATKYSADILSEQEHLAQMKLAITWKKIDYARSYFSNETNSIQWKETDLHNCLIDSLAKNNIEFVDFFISNGASFDKITLDQLNHLYILTAKDSIIPVPRRKHLFFNIRNDFYRNYFQEKYSLIGEMLCSSENGFHLGANGANRLFLWSISVHRFALSKYLSSRIWNPTVGCLLAAAFYRLASGSTTDIDLQKDYLQCYSYFDLRSAELLDQCFQTSEHLASEILRHPAASFDQFEALQVAADADARALISSKAVQTFLDKKWYGDIYYKEHFIQFKVFLATLIFPLLPIFSICLPFIRRHKKIVASVRDEREMSKPTRIDYMPVHSSTDPVRWSEKFLAFYQSPIVRFYYYGLFFFFFLLLYSYVLLVDYYPIEDPLSMSGCELVLHLWLLTFLLEEVRQFILLKSSDEYFDEVWNQIDLLAFLLYLISLLTRFTVDENLYLLSKSSISLSLIFWYIRLLHYFAAYESLGPKLVMIYGMVKDLIFFICFIMIFLIGFSVTCISLIRKSSEVKWKYDHGGILQNVTINRAQFRFQLVQDVINYGLWKVFAQVDPIEGDGLFIEIAYVLTILFVAIANILLLNVLIALFNITIQNVENRSYTLWRYQRFLIVKEFSLKSPVPPPLNLFYYLFLLIQFLYQFSRRTGRNLRRRVRRDHSTMENRDVHENFLIHRSLPSNSMRKKSSLKITDLMKREYAISDYLYKKELQTQNQ